MLTAAPDDLGEPGHRIAAVGVELSDRGVVVAEDHEGVPDGQRRLGLLLGVLGVEDQDRRVRLHVPLHGRPQGVSITDVDQVQHGPG